MIVNHGLLKQACQRVLETRDRREVLEATLEQVKALLARMEASGVKVAYPPPEGSAEVDPDIQAEALTSQIVRVKEQHALRVTEVENAILEYAAKITEERAKVG